jgi:hypothetical protein
VRKSAAGVTLAALGLVLAVAGGAVARPEAARIELVSTLDGAQEVPAPSGDVTTARGVFTASVTRSDGGAVLAWRLSFERLSGAAVAAHIHVAPRGQAGPVAVALCGPCESGASGSAQVEISVLTALAAGRAYVNVHTAANQAGEIRGQIAIRASVKTVLVARQEVPKPKGNVNRARATFTAVVTRSGPTAAIAWRLSFARLSGRAVAAHIHVGARGKAGPVAVTLCGPCRSGARGTASVKASVLRALEAGRAYVNIHTARNPAGEVRGQIAPVPLSVTAATGGGGDEGGGGGGDDPYP